MAQKATLDRFEGDWAVLVPHDGGKPLAVERSALPPCAKPGDTFAHKGDHWMLCPQETADRAERIRGKAGRLFRLSGGQDEEE